MNKRKIHILLFVVSAFSLPAWGYQYDANDFATDVTDYVPGTGITSASWGPYYNNPYVALGGPTRITMYSITGLPGPNEPVNPAHPAWAPDEVVTVGNGGKLVLMFNHPVCNDRNNPYGIDFIVYGNARFAISDNWSPGSDANAITINSLFSEPGIVSVSQDGQTWYRYSDVNLPRADAFAPTSAFPWDAAHRRWDVNSPLDATRPLDPNLKTANFTGQTVAKAVELYKGSAGGAGFDLAISGYEWIRYVKIEDDTTGTGLPEIDAVADVSACGDYRHPFPPGDMNYDCRVDFRDLAILGGDWFGHLSDMAAISGNWLSCTWECN